MDLLAGLYDAFRFVFQVTSWRYRPELFWPFAAVVIGFFLYRTLRK